MKDSVSSRIDESSFENEEKSVDDQFLVNDEESSWIVVGDIQFCLTTQYTNLPSLNLKNAVHFSACSFSGPIALAYAPTSTLWLVTIRTCSGRILKQKLEVADAFSIEWTRGHRLLILNRKGHASVYSSLGEQVRDFHFSNSIKEVQSSRMFTTSRSDSGIAIIDEECRVFVVNSVSEPIVWTINSPIREKPSAWTAFQPHSQLTHVLLIFGSQFYMGMQGEQMMIQPQVSNWSDSGTIYTQCVVDDARSRIALLTSSSQIQLVSIDLDTLFATITLEGHDFSNCLHFGWMSTSAIFAQITQNLTIFVSIKSATSDTESVRTFEKHTGFAKIGVEQDGIRIFENSKIEFCTVASKEQTAVLGVASSDDSAFLHDAAKYLDNGQGHKTYANANQVKDMNLAIDDCIVAACDSWQPNLQKTLLKAARLGMGFISAPNDTTRLMKAIREIRVLNELHFSRTGVPMTHRQLQTIGETCLINRLIDTGCYSVAVKVSQWLGGETSENVDRVLLEWVRRSINKAANSEQKYDNQSIEALEKKLSEKLLQFPHVSIADAAKRAIEAKMPKLARLFIKRETDDSKHVEILLQLDDVPAALERAATAQRPQLIHQVVKHLMSSHKRTEYELAIRKIPLAQCLYQDLVRQEGETARGVSGRQMLALLEQASDFERQTLFHFDVAETERNPSDRLNALRRAKDAAKSMGDKAIEEILSDVTAFAPSQIERGQADLSVRDTVIEMAHDTAKVSQLKHQARLSDKQVLLWTIEGLAKKGKMEQLFDLAQKKSPIGYAPFVKACVKYKRFDEVKKYMAKVNGYADLIAANISMKNYVEAAKLAFDRRDREMLHSIFLKSHEDRSQYEKCSTIWRSI